MRNRRQFLTRMFGLGATGSLAAGFALFEGTQGEKGDKGNRGDMGPPGVQGEQGKDGLSREEVIDLIKEHAQLRETYWAKDLNYRFYAAELNRQAREEMGQEV